MATPSDTVSTLLGQDTSFCSWWELTQRPKTGQYAETERYWSTPSWMGCPHQTPSLRAHGAMEKRRQKGCRSQRQWTTLRKLCPPDTTGLGHVRTHRDCSSTHRAYTGVSHMDPSAERGDGHRSPPLIKKLSGIGTYLKKENCLCQWSLTRHIKHTSGYAPWLEQMANTKRP